MRVTGTLRAAVPAMATAAVLAAGLGVLQPSAASAAALPKDAIVSSAGQVLTPRQAAAMVQPSQRFSTSGSVTAARRAGMTAQDIIGSDDRVRVNPTTTFPARATVLITRNSGLHCTGWMVSADTMVTAGHCLHTGGAGGSWYSGLQFKAGSNGGNAPYGTCNARGRWAFDGWLNSGDTRYDGGIVKLDCTVGNTVGWYYMWWQTASLNNLTTIIQGYPGDKPSTQWRSIDYVRASATENVYYQNDTINGMSGSPVYQNRGSGAPYCVGVCAMAIHTNGLYGTGLTASNNSGTRITEAKYNAFVSIINTP